MSRDGLLSHPPGKSNRRPRPGFPRGLPGHPLAIALGNTPNPKPPSRLPGPVIALVVALVIALVIVLVIALGAALGGVGVPGGGLASPGSRPCGMRPAGWRTADLSRFFPGLRISGDPFRRPAAPPMRPAPRSRKAIPQIPRLSGETIGTGQREREREKGREGGREEGRRGEGKEGKA